jgi:hypothetical protein
MVPCPLLIHNWFDKCFTCFRHSNFIVSGATAKRTQILSILNAGNLAIDSKFVALQQTSGKLGEDSRHTTINLPPA